MVVVLFVKIPGKHRALVSEATAAELERFGIARRLDDDRPHEPMRPAKPPRR